MRPHESNDLRVQKTLALIDQSFSALLLEKDYSKISVTDLCNRAKIQRKTFYTYYASLDALLREKIESMSRAYFERIAMYSVPEQIPEITRAFYLYSTEQGELYEKIVCSSAYTTIGNALLTDFVRRTWQGSPWFQSLDASQQKIILTFIFCTGAGLYRQWIEDKKQIPLETMIDLAEKLLEQGIRGFSHTLNKDYTPSHS